MLPKKTDRGKVFSMACFSSMMLFRDMLNRNRGEYFIRCTFHILVIVISCVCLYQAWNMVKAGMRIELPALEVSKAWVYAIMPPAWILLILAAIEKVIQDSHGLIDPEHTRNEEDQASSHELSEEVAA